MKDDFQSLRLQSSPLTFGAAVDQPILKIEDVLRQSHPEVTVLFPSTESTERRDENLIHRWVEIILSLPRDELIA